MATAAPLTAALPLVAVMVPAHNEARNIASTLRDLADTLAAAGIPEYMLIVVDDGSTDGTYAAAQAVAADNPRISVLRHERNRGMGAAIRTAWRAALDARARYVYPHPGDNQFYPSDLPRMLALIGDADIVIGIREAYAPGCWRKFLSRLQEAATAVLLRNRYRDMSGVNLYRAELLERLDPQLDTCWMNIELVIKAQWLGLKLLTCTLRVRPRIGGSSSIGRWRSQLTMVREFFRLLRVMWGNPAWRRRRE